MCNHFASRVGQSGQFVAQENGCGGLDLTAAVFIMLWRNVFMPSESNLILTKAERQLIALIRSLDYGEVRIIVKDKNPIRVEEIRRSIQLTNDK